MSFMDLIIDGGASTYKYVIFKNDKIYKEGESKGANFMHGLENVHFKSISEKSKIKNVYLFGAGIREEDDNSALIKHIKESFKNADTVYVNNDLEIVALAFSDRKDCVVGIIGTGSNAARCKKGKLKEKLVSGGYILGDQGSGFKIGKKVLQYYIENQFSKKEEVLFKKTYGYDKLSLITAIYESDNHKRFVASFSKFLNELSHKTRKRLLSREFYKYFRNVSKQIPGSEDLEYNFVGSIASVYEEALRHAAYDQDIKINEVIKSPFERIDTIYAYIKKNFQKK